MNVLCSRVLWHKVSHSSRLLAMVHLRVQSGREVVHRWTPLLSPNEPLLEVSDAVRVYRPHYRIRGSHSSGELQPRFSKRRARLPSTEAHYYRQTLLTGRQQRCGEVDASLCTIC